MGFVLLAAALIPIYRLLRGRSTDGSVQSLSLAAGNRRTVAARLTGGFEYGPLRSPDRAGINSSTEDLSLMAAAGRAEQAAHIDPRPINLHAYGIGLLLLGSYDDAIANLQAAVDQEPGNAAFCNDLAAAFAERASRDGRAADNPRALEYAERALQINPSLVEAVFVRALALERHGLRGRAIQAWHDYVRVDPSSGWADEARGRIAALQTPVAQERWRNLDTLFTGQDLGALDTLAMARDVPDRVPEAFLGPVLGRWARSQRPEDFDVARRVAASFAQATGDDSLQRAITALGSAGNSVVLLRAMQSLADGYSLLARDRYVDAEPPLQSALTSAALPPLFRDWATFGLGRVRYFRGAAVESERDFDGVIQSAQSAGAGALQARATWVRGIVKFTQGRWTESRTDYENAIRLFDAVHDPQGVAIVHVNLSILFRFLGDRESVWQHRMAALSRIPAHQPTLAHGFLITTAVTASLEGLEHVALLFLDEAVKNATTDIPAYTRAETRLQRARAFARVGRQGDAEADLTAAKAAWREIDDPAVARRVKLSLLTAAAQLHQETNSPAATRDAREAITDVTARGDLLRSAELHLYLGRALEHQADVASAKQAIADGIADFRKARASMPADDPIRLSAFEPVWELFDEAFALETQADNFDRSSAFETYESSRAQTLLELRDQDTSNFTTLQSQLRDGRALVLLHQQPSRLLAWVITAGADHLVRIPLPADEAKRLMAEYEWRLATNAQLGEVSRQLYSRLLAPILAQTPRAVSLTIVSDQPFTDLPWSALIDPGTGKPALQRLSITVSPNASLAVSARPRKFEAATPALVVSATNVEPNLPTLSGARDEARQVAALYPGSVLIEGLNATPSQTVGHIAGRRIIHVSAHAISNAVYPLLSHIVLASEAADLDGLTVRDLLRQSRLDPDALVVLAACSTLGSATRRGEGAIGIAWGFLAAGASTVIATLWDVDDAGIAPVLIDFHRRLIAGAAPADALRGAQLAALERGESERTWASLQLVGVP